MENFFKVLSRRSFAILGLFIQIYLNEINSANLTMWQRFQNNIVPILFLADIFFSSAFRDNGNFHVPQNIFVDNNNGVNNMGNEEQVNINQNNLPNGQENVNENNNENNRSQIRNDFSDNYKEK